jgi:hypothetical protein
VDRERDRAWDQIILMMVNTNPLPFDADPQILEFIEHEATYLYTDTKICTLTLAEEWAKSLHDQQVQVIQKHLEKDLVLLRDNANRGLNLA